MNKIRIISLILIFNLTACGFKVVNQSDLINYRIDSINTTGERKIAYRIKSNLLKINKIGAKEINLSMDVSKKKSIKERNIKNEITKYEISIEVKVVANSTDLKKFNQFTALKSGNYNVDKKYSQTLNNEKKLIEQLTKTLIDEIKEKLFIKINDL